MCLRIFNKCVKLELKWLKCLYISELFANFAVSINDKGKSKILKYILQRYYNFFVKNYINQLK